MLFFVIGSQDGALYFKLLSSMLLVARLVVASLEFSTMRRKKQFNHERGVV